MVGVKTFMIYKHFLHDRSFLLCFQVFFKENNETHRSEFLTRDLFVCFAGYLKAILLLFSQKSLFNSFGQDRRKNFLHLTKMIGTVEELIDLVQSFSMNFRCFPQVRDKKH